MAGLSIASFLDADLLQQADSSGSMVSNIHSLNIISQIHQAFTFIDGTLLSTVKAQYKIRLENAEKVNFNRKSH